MSENQYNPLQWPPDMTLAQLHFDCCKPGIDNTQGRKCPCCNRYEKLSNSRWPARDIVKDFKNFGGGIPGYFHLLIYLMVVLIILCGVAVVYHIMLLNQVCPTLEKTPQRCVSVFKAFLFCDSDILYNSLVNSGNQSQANALLGIQLATYLILVLSTIGIKVILHVLNKGKNLDGKLFSRFSLIIKNVPLYYQLQDLKQELKAIDPTVQISQIFYVYKTCECEKSFKNLCDLYFLLKKTEENLEIDSREKYQRQYKKMKNQYLKQYDKYQKELQNLKASSKKVVIVFNTIEQKEKIHKALKMNEILKSLHYLSKMFGCRNQPIGYYSQRIAQPQQVHWKYIGESSTQKLRVRLSTTIIGLGLIAISFGIFYVPMIKIDIDRIQAPSIGNALNTVISIIIFILMVIYRVFVVKLIPTRRPSSKLAESYFFVLTCTVFNFFFYLASPACFYLFVTSIPSNYKLAELFMTAFSFCIFSLILNLLDFGYLGFNSKKKKLLNKLTEAKTFCQSRLHEEVTPPAFPVAFKLVMVFQVWIFNSFYVFNIPYLLLFFFVVLFLLYWIDKFILYNHYKMQSYLSLELEHKAQKAFLVVFLVCVSLGYLTITQFDWQKWMVLGVFIIAIVLNFSLQFLFKKQKDQEVLKTSSDLRGAIQRCKTDAIASNTLNMMEQEMKNSFIFNDPKAFAAQVSEASLASAIYMYGYQQTYQLYLSQFGRTQVHSMLENKYFQIKKAFSTHVEKTGKTRQSQLAKLVDQSLQKKLIDSTNELKQGGLGCSPSVVKHYEPPKVQNVTFQSSGIKDSRSFEQNSRQSLKQQVKEQKKQEKEVKEVEGQLEVQAKQQVKFQLVEQPKKAQQNQAIVQQIKQQELSQQSKSKESKKQP